MDLTCPWRIGSRACEKRACCDWTTFLHGFTDAWPKWFTVEPTRAQWSAARHDWREGNTGWEAAHNAMSRAKEAAESKSEYVWIGGKNYALAGSALAIRFGKAPSPPADQGSKEGGA